MPKEITLVLSPGQASDESSYMAVAEKRAGIGKGEAIRCRIIRRTVDARSRAVKVNLTVELFSAGEVVPTPAGFDFSDVSGRTPVIIVGSGPAGLFAALKLIESGLRPIIVERGKEVQDRKRDIAQLNRGITLDADSNYAYGEGGAGTFSDGKLFTRSKKRGDNRRAMELLVHHGASPEILYESHPHIGSDALPRIISNIRRTIVSCGGEFYFNRRVTGLEIAGDRITGVRCGGDLFEGAAVILATGHSPDDLYEMLHREGVALEAKPFAMGVRVEHPQGLIDSIQYHTPERGPYLPAAAYSLVSQIGGRGVYSFCMCPGGFIVPAMTSPDGCVVNGMSPSARNSPYANSGIVTEIRPGDYAHLVSGHGPLAAMRLRQQLERAAREAAGTGVKAPAQRLDDFVSRRRSASLPGSSYIPGLCSSNFPEWMPPFIFDSLRGGFLSFGTKMRGFMTGEALVAGVESRTSSPVRILRDSGTGMNPSVEGLFPAGEGAGYAGGILSAAMDGETAAVHVAAYCH